jgi:hypothetical protein
MDFPGSNLPLQIRFTNPFALIRVLSWFRNEVYELFRLGFFVSAPAKIYNSCGDYRHFRRNLPNSATVSCNP